MTASPRPLSGRAGGRIGLLLLPPAGLAAWLAAEWTIHGVRDHVLPEAFGYALVASTLLISILAALTRPDWTALGPPLVFLLLALLVDTRARPWWELATPSLLWISHFLLSLDHSTRRSNPSSAHGVWRIPVHAAVAMMLALVVTSLPMLVARLDGRPMVTEAIDPGSSFAVGLLLLLSFLLLLQAAYAVQKRGGATTSAGEAIPATHPSSSILDRLRPWRRGRPRETPEVIPRV